VVRTLCNFPGFGPILDSIGASLSKRDLDRKIDLLIDGLAAATLMMVSTHRAV
jgi:hypothetical protein